MSFPIRLVIRLHFFPLLLSMSHCNVILQGQRIPILQSVAAIQQLKHYE